MDMKKVRVVATRMKKVKWGKVSRVDWVRPILEAQWGWSAGNESRCALWCVAWGRLYARMPWSRQGKSMGGSWPARRGDAVDWTGYWRTCHSSGTEGWSAMSHSPAGEGEKERGRCRLVSMLCYVGNQLFSTTATTTSSMVTGAELQWCFTILLPLYLLLLLQCYDYHRKFFLTTVLLLFTNSI